jgi:hypothetical protein
LRYIKPMFKRILQICFCLMLLMLLTTGAAFSDRLPQGVLIADHTSDHQGMRPTDQTPPPQAPEATSGEPVDTPSTATVKAPSVEPVKAPTLKAPKEPIDPYDYDDLREANESIYGAGK